MKPRGPIRVALAACAALWLGACAPVPRPLVMVQLDQVRQGSTATDARTYAPSAFAHAEKLRREADAAFDAGDPSGAQILAEQALAAYAHARGLARIARAEAAGRASQAELAKSQAELATLEAEQARVGAELDALELRVKVARDAQPVVPSGPADPAREKARAAAARALALQARLLCGAARLLLMDAPAPAPAAAPTPAQAAPSPALTGQLDAANTALTKLDAELAAPSSAVPIDQATRVRAGCLAVLTAVRRAATPVAHAPGAGDALLSELSAVGGLAPSRDDRGVVVTLRGVFAGNALSPAAEKRLADLGRVASTHPTFPVLVVLHQDKAGKDDAAQKAQADLVVKALKAASAPRAEPILAGAVAPVVDPAGGDKARNARVEIVFVTPEAF